MELILTEDVPNLGSLGDTVQVKSGYGRNFLIPKGKALLAKGKESKELRHRVEYIKKLREGKIELAKEQATRLKSINLEVVRKAGSEGKLFGSVSNRDLNELLKDNNFDFGRRAISINTPIRSVGTHEFNVRIHSEVVQSLKIKVIADKENIKQAEKSDENKKDLKDKDTEDIEVKNEKEEEQDIKLEKSFKEKQELKESNASKEKQDVKERKETKGIKNPKEKVQSKKVLESVENNEIKEKQELKEDKEPKEKQKKNKKSI